MQSEKFGSATEGPTDLVPLCPATFRQTLGFFATGVAVVTAVSKEGERLGVTVTSFNSVSLTPPLVLFSLARSLRSFEAWRTARYFAINLLGAGQDALSNQFAKAQTDKWRGVAVTIGLNGVPLLRDAPARFECELYARYDGGDHEIVIGLVRGLLAAEQCRDPLVFYRSRYRLLNAESPEAMRDAAVAFLSGW